MTGGDLPQIESASTDLDICIFLIIIMLCKFLHDIPVLEVELLISKHLSCLNFSPLMPLLSNNNSFLLNSSIHSILQRQWSAHVDIYNNKKHPGLSLN